MEKGETITCPLAASAGTISGIAVFAFSCHTVLQKIAFAREGRLRIFVPIIKKKAGEKGGKRGKVPWESGAGTTCCISVYLLNHYTVLQKNTFAREGRLRIFAPIIKKRGQRGKRGKKGEEGCLIVGTLGVTNVRVEGKDIGRGSTA